MLHVPREFDDLWSSYEQELGERQCSTFPPGLASADDLLSFSEDIQLPDLPFVDDLNDAAHRPINEAIQQPLSPPKHRAREQPPPSVLLPFNTLLSTAANGGSGRPDFHEAPADEKYWQQQLWAQASRQVAESPFSSSTVQSTTTISRPQQLDSYAGCEGDDSLTIDGSFPQYSSALGSGISTTSNLLSCGSEMLPSDLTGVELGRQYYLQGRNVPTTARQNRRLWSAQDEALHLSRAHSDAAGMLLPHRAASTPVAGADLLAGPGRVSKRSWEEAAAASAAAPGRRGKPLERQGVHRILIPSRNRGHCIRIVTGRGEFEAKPLHQLARETRLFSRVRSNELGLAREEVVSGGDEHAGRTQSSRNNSFTGSRQPTSNESANKSEEMMTTRTRPKLT